MEFDRGAFERDVLSSLMNAIRRSRGYATFFEWPDRGMKELGVVASLLESMRKAHDLRYRDAQISSEDPPDVIASTSAGGQIGFEVTEIVSEEAIQRRKAGEDVYADWTDDEFLAELGRRIGEKDLKQFAGGPYSERLLLVFTDELTVSHEAVGTKLASMRFPAPRVFTGGYLLFSYQPGLDRCPYYPILFS